MRNALIALLLLTVGALSGCASGTIDKLNAGLDTTQHALATVDQQVQSLAPQVSDAIAKLATIFPALTAAVAKVDAVLVDVKAVSAVAHTAIDTAVGARNDLAVVAADFKAKAEAAGVDTSKTGDLLKWALQNPTATTAAILSAVGVGLQRYGAAKAKIREEIAKHGTTQETVDQQAAALNALNIAMADVPPDVRAKMMAAASNSLGYDSPALDVVAGTIHA